MSEGASAPRAEDPGRDLSRALGLRIFFAFFLVIVASVAVAVGVGELTGGPRGPGEYGKVVRVTAERLEPVWGNTKARDDLARATSRKLDSHLTLLDAEGNELFRTGERCSGRILPLDVVRGKEVIGKLSMCPDRSKNPWPLRWALVLAGNLSVILLASFLVARRLGEPLRNLVETAREIGEGRLGARVPAPESMPAEARVLARTMNEMAGRIEAQMDGQRALLATVSHEIRTPLARLRLLLDKARETKDPHTLSEIEREIVDIDELVSELLAASRVDFVVPSQEAVRATRMAIAAVEHAEIDPSLLASDLGDGEDEVWADATLLERAMRNLLWNAKRHAGGPTSVRLFIEGDALGFEVEDRGPGFEGDGAALFEPFKKRHERSGGVGIGLSLVRRIAEAHGGRVWARNREGGGAVVGFSVDRRPAHVPLPPEAARLPAAP